MTDTTLYRQGDVLLMAVDRIPENLPRLKRPVLASGDSTGHAHHVREAGTVRLYRAIRPDELSEIPAEHYLEVIADEAVVVHPEHGQIKLPRGCYRVWRQRE